MSKSSTSTLSSTSHGNLAAISMASTGRVISPHTTDITINHVRVTSTGTNSKSATSSGQVPSSPPARASPVPSPTQTGATPNG
ncbi:hypothetical protein KC334_g4439, partial [Hortaea werneckii]